MELKINVDDCSLSNKLVKFLKDNNICVNITHKSFNSYKDITSFEDALECLGEVDEYVDYHAVVKSHHYALYKLETIIKAINKIENWEPNWQNYNQKKCYPWFFLGSPFRFFDTYYRNAFTYAGCASRLYLPSSEIATYVGKEFLNLWKEYML